MLVYPDFHFLRDARPFILKVDLTVKGEIAMRSLELLLDHSEDVSPAEPNGHYMYR